MALNLSGNINLKDIDLKTIYEWPLWGRALVMLIVFIGVFYFGYFFDFSSQSKQMFTRYKQEKDLKNQVKSSLRSEEEMSELVSQYPQFVKLLNQWQGQLIDGNNLPDLLNQILKLGTLNHLQFSIFAPGVKKQTDDYYVVPIKVVVRGDYKQVAAFVSGVANLPQIVSVGNLLILKPTEPTLGLAGNKQQPQEETATPGSIASEMTLEVYYLANNKK